MVFLSISFHCIQCVAVWRVDSVVPPSDIWLANTSEYEHTHTHTHTVDAMSGKHSARHSASHLQSEGPRTCRRKMAKARCQDDWHQPKGSLCLSPAAASWQVQRPLPMPCRTACRCWGWHLARWHLQCASGCAGSSGPQAALSLHCKLANVSLEVWRCCLM